MKKEKDNIQYCDKNKRKTASGGFSGAVYGLGFIGSLVYYMQHATSLWIGIIGFLKALVWPALLTYKIFELLKL